MTTTTEQHRPALSSAIVYRDPKAAFRWLEEAFGFEPSMVILDAEDNLVHSEMRFGDGLIMVGRETVRSMTPEEWDQVSGLRTRKRL